MKQRLFVLVAVSALITAPALAHGVAVVNVSTFGDPIVGETLTDTTVGGIFQLRITAQVYSKFDAGAGKTLYTYVYSIFHDSTSNLITVSFLDMLFDPTLDAGYVGLSDPFSDDPDVSGPLVFHLDTAANWDGLEPPTGTAVVVYASSYGGPVEGIVYSGDNATIFGDPFSGYGITIGAGDPGTGAGLAPTPEPASLLLLTSGLLSGGFLRFRKKKRN